MDEGEGRERESYFIGRGSFPFLNNLTGIYIGIGIGIGVMVWGEI